MHGYLTKHIGNLSLKTGRAGRVSQRPFLHMNDPEIKQIYTKTNVCASDFSWGSASGVLYRYVLREDTDIKQLKISTEEHKKIKRKEKKATLVHVNQRLSVDHRTIVPFRSIISRRRYSE